MRRIKQTSVLAGTLAVFLAISSATAAVVQNSKDPFAFPVFNPCTGEEVFVEGTVHIVISSVEKDGVVTDRVRLNAHGVGYGWTTGDTYIWNDTIHEDVTIGPFPQFMIINDQHLRLISKGASSNGRVKAGFVFKIDADGNASFEGFSDLTCQ